MLFLFSPQFKGVSYEKIDAMGSIQWPCNDESPDGTPIMHVNAFVEAAGLIGPLPVTTVAATVAGGLRAAF